MDYGGISPLFVIFYIVLCTTIVYIFKIYFVESEHPSVFVVMPCIISFIICLWKFPRDLGETLMAFASYLAIASFPSAFIVIVLSKLIAEFLIGAKDFMGFSKRDPMEELEEQLEAFIVAGKFEDAIALLREKMKKNPKDHRYNSEIATISLMYLKDYKTALAEFQQVLKKTGSEEGVVFALYRMADIYLMYLDEKDKALACLQKIIKEYPNSEYARTAAIRVEFMEKEEPGETAGGDWRMGEKEVHEAYDMCPEPEKAPGPATEADWRQGFIDEAESEAEHEEGPVEKSPRPAPRPWTMAPDAGRSSEKEDDDDF